MPTPGRHTVEKKVTATQNIQNRHPKQKENTIAARRLAQSRDLNIARTHGGVEEGRGEAFSTRNHRCVRHTMPWRPPQTNYAQQ